MRRARPSRSSNGVSRSIPSAPGDRLDHPGEQGLASKSGQTATAPWRRLRRPSGTSTAGLAPCWMPSPWQTGHQPSGLLNEKWCGSSSSKLRPQRVADAVLAVAVDGPARLLGFVADPRDVHDPLAQVERRFDRVGESGSGRAADDRPVDHDLDLVLAAVAQLGRLVQADRLAVDPHPGEARGPQLVPERLIALAVATLDRRHHVDLRPLGQVEDLLDDLVGGLRADRDVALRAIRLTQPGEEDAQIVVDLGDGADGRARALAGRLLLDADRRREARDPLDLRLLERGQELPGVAREALDVPPLTLGVERVDGQRALARPARPAANRHLVAGDVHVDPLEVVLPRAPDLDGRQPGLGRLAAVLRGWCGTRLLPSPALFGGFHPP